MHVYARFRCARQHKRVIEFEPCDFERLARDQKTPAGTYTITVNGAAGALSHSVTLTLVVQ